MQTHRAHSVPVDDLKADHALDRSDPADWARHNRITQPRPHRCQYANKTSRQAPNAGVGIERFVAESHPRQASVQMHATARSPRSAVRWVHAAGNIRAKPRHTNRAVSATACEPERAARQDFFRDKKASSILPHK